MPAYIRSGGQWVETIPRVHDAGAWSGDQDVFWVRDEGVWKQIYPDPAAGGDLLPVENLAASSITHNSALATWTLPTQPTITPTAVSINFPDTANVWTEYPYPLTSIPVGALQADKDYQVRVKLVQRVDGAIAEESPERSVFFKTLVAPVGEPAPDPGGTGGDSNIPINIPVPPGGTWTPPSTVDGCWLEWELFIVDLATLAWITTGLTGTHNGSVANFQYDLATLDPTRTYRFCFNTACDTTGDGVADTFGPSECSESFVGLADWGALCGGIPDSDLAGLAATADAVYGFPQICLDGGGQRVALFDRVSGTEVGKGPDFLWAFQDATGDGNWKVQADADGGVTMLAPITALETLMVPAQDSTYLVSYQHDDGHTLTNGRQYPVAAIGGLMLSFWIHETATTWQPVVLALAAGGVLITLNGPTLVLDSEMHAFVLRWDDDGNKELWVDGTLADTDASAVSWRS